MEDPRILAHRIKEISEALKYRRKIVEKSSKLLIENQELEPRLASKRRLEKYFEITVQNNPKKNIAEILEGINMKRFGPTGRKLKLGLLMNKLAKNSAENKELSDIRICSIQNISDILFSRK